MPRFASVALPVSLEREFTYLIPPDLESAIQVGVRVIVPFGRQVATGLIVGLPEATQVQGLKPIRDVIDGAPVVTDELLQLCRWVAQYYLAPLGDVLRAAIPHGSSATSKRLVRPTTDLTEERVSEVQRSAPKRAVLLAAILERGPMLSSDLQKAAGLKSVNTVLLQLEREGLVTTDDVLPRPKVKPKLQDIVLLDRIDRHLLSQARLDLSPRKKKAAAVLDAVAAQLDLGSEDIPATDLLRLAGAAGAALKEFVISGLLPVERREVTRLGVDYGTEEQSRHIVLNDAQKSALGAIATAVDAATARTFLLHGVTGSGKTQVYIEAIRHCLERGKTAIVLVPEIALTPQMVRRFKTHFADRVGVVHSRMSPGERHDVWRQARCAQISVVIGPRSAVFAPLVSVGLIVVDEEHESSYKQYDAVPRYHARDVAIVRGVQNSAVVVLGSATPSAESYQNATTGKYTLLEMPQRIDAVPMPEITIVDMTAERKKAYANLKALLKVADRGKVQQFTQSSISSVLCEQIEDRLSRHEGIILLQNRRGFAPFVECPDCGYTERCENCNVTLTYHLVQKHLRCHYCGLVREPHELCPQCGGSNIRMLGVGTQRVEQDLAMLFPAAKVVRMDLDTTARKGAHDRILTQFGSGDADILLGTQMVAKGLDFARVTLVGVISADTQMLLPDFRSTERTFQLLTQVAGRAGRSTLKGEVIIQTYQPKHYSLQHVVDHDFGTFYREEIETRKDLDYPPFSRLMLVETKGKDERRVQHLAEDVGAYLKRSEGMFKVLGPAPALIGKINNFYRWHIIVKSLKQADQTGAAARQALRAATEDLGRKYADVKLIIDVDPVGLM